MIDEPASTGTKHTDTLFKPGQSGNPLGRPKGSRNKLGEAFISALHDDFVEHGKGVIETVRMEKPDAYLKVVASILPQQIEVKDNTFDGIGDDELAALIVAARQALGVAGDPEPGGQAQISAREPDRVH